MKELTGLRIVLVVLIFAGGALGWHEAGLARGCTAAGVAAVAQADRLRHQLADTQARTAVIAGHRREVEAKVARLRTALGNGPAAGPKSEPELELELALDPGDQAIRLKLARLRMELNYLPLFRRLGWSREQIEHFGDLFADSAAQSFDIYSAADALGLAYTSPEIAGLLKAKEDELGTAERQWMGAGAFAQLQQFDQTEQERTTTDRLSRDLLFTGSPLSGAQSGQLVETLRASRVPDDLGSGPGEIDWDRAVQQAATYLSPPQLDEFKSTAAGARALEMQQQLGKMIRSWETTLPPPAQPSPAAK